MPRHPARLRGANFASCRYCNPKKTADFYRKAADERIAEEAA